MALTSREAYLQRARVAESEEEQKQVSSDDISRKQRTGLGRTTAEVFGRSSNDTFSDGIAEITKPGFDRFVPAKFTAFDENVTRDASERSKPLSEIIKEARELKKAELANENDTLAPQLTLDDADKEFLRKIQEKEEALRYTNSNEEDEELVSFRKARASAVREIDFGHFPIVVNARDGLERQGFDMTRRNTVKLSVSTNRRRPSIPSDVLNGHTVVVKKRRSLHNEGTQKPRNTGVVDIESLPLVKKCHNATRSCTQVDEEQIHKNKHLSLVSYNGDDMSSSSDSNAG